MALMVASELAAAQAEEQEAFCGLFRLHDTESYQAALRRWVGAAERLCWLNWVEPTARRGPV
jgi:hypothetical protein